MKIKKLIAVILSVSMIGGIVTGCGSTGTNQTATNEDVTDNSETSTDSNVASADNKAKLTFWDFHTGSESDVIKGMVDEYNNTHNDVYIEYSTVNQSDYTTTLVTTAYANGECPDILWVEPSTFKKFSEAGILADLSNYYTEDLKNDLLASCLNEATGDDGKIYTLPFECETLGLFYDADVLKEAGLEPPTTWEELKTDAEKLTTGDRYGIVLPVEKTPYTMFNWWPFMWMNQAEVYDANGNVTVNSDKMAETLDFWGSFYQNGYCPSSLQDGPWSIDNIANGVAAMQIGGTYMINAAEEYNKNGHNISVAPLPSPDGKTYITAAGGQMMGVCSQSENIDAAADFVFWCFGSDDITNETKWCTEAKFAYPARQSVINANQDTFNVGLKKIFTDFYSTATPEPKYASEVTEVLEDMLQQVMFGNANGKTAAEDAKKKIEAIK
ncbi:MAG: sugar ABC transporter substrate-binding protein [Lachnospiraceae bacterium]|nr:sugar ABC transporter substrate-binding protein [Lachnospiraceae bacterium]